MYAKPRVALISGWTDPTRHAVPIYVSKLISLLLPSSDEITWVATNLMADPPLNNKITLVRIKSTYVPRDESSSRLIPYYLVHQFKQILTIVRLLPKVDVFVFAQGFQKHTQSPIITSY